MASSELAEFRQQQARQEEAALLGLYGLASGVSRHAFIEARMERAAGHILPLLADGKHEEAETLMTTRTRRSRVRRAGRGGTTDMSHYDTILV